MRMCSSSYTYIYAAMLVGEMCKRRLAIVKCECIIKSLMGQKNLVFTYFVWLYTAELRHHQEKGSNLNEFAKKLIVFFLITYLVIKKDLRAFCVGCSPQHSDDSSFFYTRPCTSSLSTSTLSTARSYTHGAQQ